MTWRQRLALQARPHPLGASQPREMRADENDRRRTRRCVGFERDDRLYSVIREGVDTETGKAVCSEVGGDASAVNATGIVGPAAEFTSIHRAIVALRGAQAEADPLGPTRRNGRRRSRGPL